MRYKLRMFRIPIEGPTNDFCDNRGVVLNSSRPESTFQKKHNGVNYHVVREAATAGILREEKEDGTTNLADLLTKDKRDGTYGTQLCGSLDLGIDWVLGFPRISMFIT